MEYAIDYGALVNTATANIEIRDYAGSPGRTKDLDHGVVLKFDYPDDAFSSLITVKPAFDLYERLSAKYDWVSDLIASYDSFSTVSDIAPYYKNITRLLVAGEFEDVDSLLKCVDVSECSDLFLVGFARLTSGYKDELPSWGAYVSELADEVIRRDLDERVLVGLI